MPYRTAASKLNKEIYEKYQKHVANKGVSIHMDLKKYIEAELGINREVSESKNERTKLGKTENDNPRGNKNGESNSGGPRNDFLW